MDRPRIRHAIMLTAAKPINNSGVAFDSGMETGPGVGGCGFVFQQAGSRKEKKESHELGEAYAEAHDNNMMTARDFNTISNVNPT